MLLLTAFFLWIGIAILEMVHGILRAKFLAPRVGDFRSRQIGVATGSVLILVYTWAIFPWLGLDSASDALQVGLLWFLCMLVFELSIGHFVFRFSWKWLLNDFNLFQGRLLAIGMLVLLGAPWFWGWMLGRW